MSDVDTVIHTLEHAAENAGDITQAIYARYYALCPEAHDLMAHVDGYMQGRMMQEVMRLLMAEDSAEDRGYLEFEVRNHAGYAVAAGMYPALLGAVRDVVRDAAGETWTAASEAAWQRRIDTLLDAILTHAA